MGSTGRGHEKVALLAAYRGGTSLRWIKVKADDPNYESHPAGGTHDVTDTEI